MTPTSRDRIAKTIPDDTVVAGWLIRFRLVEQEIAELERQLARLQADNRQLQALLVSVPVPLQDEHHDHEQDQQADQHGPDGVIVHHSVLTGTTRGA